MLLQLILNFLVYFMNVTDSIFNILLLIFNFGDTLQVFLMTFLRQKFFFQLPYTGYFVLFSLKVRSSCFTIYYNLSSKIICFSACSQFCLKLPLQVIFFLPYLHFVQPLKIHYHVSTKTAFLNEPTQKYSIFNCASENLFVIQ